MARSRPEPERFIVDNSVWAPLATSADVRTNLIAIVNLHSSSAITICPPIAAEVGFSARSGADHDQVMKQLAAFAECPTTPTSANVLELQNRLWNGGLLRSVGDVGLRNRVKQSLHACVVLEPEGWAFRPLRKQIAERTPTSGEIGRQRSEPLALSADVA